MMYIRFNTVDQAVRIVRLLELMGIARAHNMPIMHDDHYIIIYATDDRPVWSYRADKYGHEAMSVEDMAYQFNFDKGEV